MACGAGRAGGIGGSRQVSPISSRQRRIDAGSLSAPHSSFQRFESFGTGHIHIAILSAPTMEARFGDVVLAANRIDGVVTVGWAQNADNSFGTMSPLLHQTVP